MIFSVKWNWLISVGLAGGGGGEELLAGSGTRGATGENGTMSKISVGTLELFPPCQKDEQWQNQYL